MSEMITRQEAIALGLTRGRIDYLIKNGLVKKEMTEINSRPRMMLDKEQVLHFIASPLGGLPRHRSKKPTGYLTKKALGHAVIALGVCAQLMKNEQIKAKFNGATVTDLLSAADKLEKRIKEAS